MDAAQYFAANQMFKARSKSSSVKTRRQVSTSQTRLSIRPELPARRAVAYKPATKEGDPSVSEVIAVPHTGLRGQPIPGAQMTAKPGRKERLSLLVFCVPVSLSSHPSSQSLLCTRKRTEEPSPDR